MREMDIAQWREARGAAAETLGKCSLAVANRCFHDLFGFD